MSKLERTAMALCLAGLATISAGNVATAQAGRLSGMWMSAGMRAEPAANDTVGSGARSAQQGAGAPEPPLKPEFLGPWRQRQKETQDKEARGEAPFENWLACLPTGVPSMMNAIFPLEVLEAPGQVTMIAELHNQTRRIYLDKPQTVIDDTEPGYYGRSVGRWEGDTLVVDTIAIKEAVRYRDVPHSPQQRISERIRLATPDLMEDQVTIEDPAYLTRPWTFTIRNKRYTNAEMREYVCENNRVFIDPNTGKQRLRVETDK
jgi:hypothetical protein